VKFCRLKKNIKGEEMKKTLRIGLYLFIFALVLQPVLASKAMAAVEFETENFKIAIGDNGKWESIFDKTSARELVGKTKYNAFAYVTYQGKTYASTSVKKAGYNIHVTFSSIDTKLAYSVVECKDWMHFQLQSVIGTRPEKIILCQLPINITENVGRTLNIAWDKQTSVVLLGANLPPDCKGSKRDGVALLTATTQDSPGPHYEGNAIAIIVSPTAQIKDILRKASHVFDILTNEDEFGVPSKEIYGRNSYFFFTKATENDAERMIEYCKKTNIDQALILFSSWATSAGHIDYRLSNFPEGKDSLKSFAKKFNDAGIGLGSHTFVSKVGKRDKYVTPIPDKRFWVDLPRKSLAVDVDKNATEIKTKESLAQWPGSPVCKRKNWDAGVKKHQEFTMGDEIIKYETIGPEGVWDTFMGCKRGSYKTYTYEHKAGAEIVHWGYESSNRYIIDQESSLADEVTQRMADVFNECGFNMVYFDGGEDVPRTRFGYYASMAHIKTLNKFRNKPFFHLGTSPGRTQRTWHSYTTGSTVDTYINTMRGHAIGRGGTKVKHQWTLREHINKSVKRVIATKADLMNGELGWFGIWPKGYSASYGIVTDGLQLDETEYLMVKSLAYDAPISLETNFKTMDSHPLTPGILDIVGVYQDLRMNRKVDDATLKMLQELDKDFSYINRNGKVEFYATSEVKEVAGTHDIRSWIGQLKTGDTAATIWHYTGDAITLDINAENVKAYDIAGNEIALKTSDNGVIVPINHQRLTLVFKGTSQDKAKAALNGAKVL
jgi:hypothetical protein